MFGRKKVEECTQVNYSQPDIVKDNQEGNNRNESESNIDLFKDIVLLNIEYIRNSIIFYVACEMPYRRKELEGIKVTFDYKKVGNCTILIGTDKELTIEDIKKRILDVIIG